MGEDVEHAGEAVTGRVSTGRGFSCRRGRAGGAGGILPVGDDLRWGTHFHLHFISGGPNFRLGYSGKLDIYMIVNTYVIG